MPDLMEQWFFPFRPLFHVLPQPDEELLQHLGTLFFQDAGGQFRLMGKLLKQVADRTAGAIFVVLCAVVNVWNAGIDEIGRAHV